MKKIDKNINQFNLNQKQHRQSSTTKSKQSKPHFRRNSKNCQQFTPKQSLQQYNSKSKPKNQITYFITQNQYYNKGDKDYQLTKITKDKTNSSSYLTIKGQFQIQIQRLNHLLSKKQLQINNLIQNNNKKQQQLIQLQTQLTQIINENEQKEFHLKNYEKTFKKISKQCDQKSKYKSQVQQLVLLFQNIRKQNQFLFIHLQKNKILFNKTNQKYHLLKYHNQKQSVNHKQQYNSNGGSNNKISKQQKYVSIKMLQQKITNIQYKITSIHQQNQLLFKQIKQKDELIFQLKNQLHHFQSQNKQKQNIIYSLHKKYDSHFKLSHPSTHSSPQHCLLQSTKSLNQIYINKKLLLIMLKTKYNLMYSKITHRQLIHNLSHIELNHDIFLQFPYNLTENQYQQLLKWIQQLRQLSQKSNSPDQLQQLKSILKQNIPCFSNSTVKKQHTLKIQIYNQYQNRQQQLNKKLGNNQNILNIKKTHEYFKNWGLNRQQRDILMKSYYDYTNQLDHVNLSILKNIIVQWEKK